jgi:hypothetical protein
MNSQTVILISREYCICVVLIKKHYFCYSSFWRLEYTDFYELTVEYTSCTELYRLLLRFTRIWCLNIQQYSSLFIHSFNLVSHFEGGT